MCRFKFEGALTEQRQAGVPGCRGQCAVGADSQTPRALELVLGWQWGPRAHCCDINSEQQSSSTPRCRDLSLIHSLTGYSLSILAHRCSDSI